jgi:hypothetical protein
MVWVILCQALHQAAERCLYRHQVLPLYMGGAGLLTRDLCHHNAHRRRQSHPNKFSCC